MRGHFKDYSVKGLFGKYKKVYWWDSQVRGEVIGGVVDKDYRVKGSSAAYRLRTQVNRRPCSGGSVISSISITRMCSDCGQP